MSNLIVTRLTNANVYFNGSSLLGQAEEVDLPDVESKMVEHKGLGMFGSPEFPSGINKMTSRIKWASFYPGVMPQIYSPRTPIAIQVRGDMETWITGALQSELPVVAFLTALPTKPGGFKFKKQENAESETSFSVTYYKLVVAGAPQVEIDVIANVFNVLGVDILAQFRANLGG